LGDVDNCSASSAITHNPQIKKLDVDLWRTPLKRLLNIQKLSNKKVIKYSKVIKGEFSTSSTSTKGMLELLGITPQAP